ncbi:glycosyltransferase family 2 protein [Emticicia fluvialis]|uniref:glycosyltransferase family 2 protein n=1 Tax=Emticicia fluvialis TaxID=2974474 RepID=UPI002166787B|nr:glycosyltransferase family 2 protein [Emticicia fluvialis]
MQKKTTKIPLSIVTLTLNNQRTLDSVLKSVADWADELLVLDCGSTDETESIARKYEANFLYRKFDNFGKQKAYAVSKAKNDWVFIVDSDEVVSDELREEILDVFQNASFEGYMIPNTLIFLGKPLRYGREYKMPHLRLFNRKHGNYNDKEIHEDVILNGKRGSLKNHVLHNSYADVTDFLNKINNYTTKGAVELHRAEKKVSVFNIIIKFPLKFFIEYLFRLNFLNGYRGFVWSFGQAFGSTMKYIKLHEINQNNFKSGY